MEGGPWGGILRRSLDYSGFLQAGISYEENMNTIKRSKEYFKDKSNRKSFELEEIDEELRNLKEMRSQITTIYAQLENEVSRLKKLLEERV